MQTQRLNGWVAVLAIALVVGLTPATRAADQWWDTATNSGLTQGSAAWNTSATVWASSGSPGTNAPTVWTNGNNALFTAGSSTATVDNVTAGWLALYSSTWLAGTGALTLTNGITTYLSSSTAPLPANPHGGQGANGSAYLYCDVNLTNNQAWHISNWQALVVTGRITGAYTLTKCGGAPLTLSNSASSFGGLVIENGSVSAYNGGSVLGGGPLTVGATTQPDELGAWNTPTLTLNSPSSGTLTTTAGNVTGTGGGVIVLNANTDCTNVLSAGTLARSGRGTLGLSCGNTPAFGSRRQVYFSGGTALANGALPLWFAAVGEDTASFLTYTPSGVVQCAYDSSFNPALSNRLVSSTTALAADQTCYAIKLNGSLNLSGKTLTLGDGNAGGLSIRSGSITNGTLSIGTSELFVVQGNVAGTIAVPITGSAPMTVNCHPAGNVVLTISNSTLYAGGPITIWSPAKLTLVPTADVTMGNTVYLTPGTTLTKSGPERLTLESSTNVFDVGSSLTVNSGTLAFNGVTTSKGGGALTVNSATFECNGGVLTNGNLVFGGSTTYGTTVILSNNAQIVTTSGSTLTTGGTNTVLKVLSGAVLSHSGASPPTDNIGGYNVLWLIDGGTVTNLGRMMFEYLRDSNIVITNGGKMYIMATGGNDNRLGGAGASNTTITVAQGGLLDYGQMAEVGYSRESSSLNNRLIIDGGMVSNSTAAILNVCDGSAASGGPWTNRDNSLIVRNNGRLLLKNSMTVGKGGTGNTVSGGSATISSGALVQAIGNSISLNVGSGTNCFLNWTTVDGGGIAGGAVVTNFMVSVGSSSYSNTLTVTNGGVLVSSSGGDSTLGSGVFGFGNRLDVAGGNPGAVSVFDLAGRSLTVGSGANSNTLTLGSGGQIRRVATLTVGSGASNNTATLRNGALLETTGLVCGVASIPSAANTITSQGGIFQFTTATPTITPNGSGNISLADGVISFRNVASVNITNNWGGSQLTNITFSGANAFRLDNATNNTAAGQSQTYVFADPASTHGAANYAGLEMVNGGTAYTNGSVTIGTAASTNGWLLFSNTTAVIWGAVTNYGKLVNYNSTVTFMSDLKLAEGSRLYVGTNGVSVAMAVNGTLTLPTHASITFTTPIGPNDTVTLFTSPNTIGGSVADWTGPGSHVISKTANQLVLRPRLPGFVFMVD